MWMQCSRVLRERAERGLYFPINHRIIDQRNTSASGAEEADIQSRYRRQLRSSFVTGETRQTEPPAWSQRTRPTHFFSLPLPTRCLLRVRVKEMHDSMLFSNAHIEPLLIPAAKLHVTLGVMSISGDTSTAEKAADPAAPDVLAAIQDCVDQACHDTCTGPLQLRFRGLGTFGHGRVLFARCITEAHFTTLDTLVRRIRRDVGLGLGVDMKGNPNDSYVPHVTVAKLRPSQIGEFGRQLPMSMWAAHQHHDFGDVTFNRVDLCSMKGQGKDGYYHVVSSVTV
ncbi:AKAP7 2'5' RNA ligase-like domain/2'-5' RNA ligase superfamily, putative [Leishmania lindenbergi]|uniref:AKAP7 2'5' RNA ligase-like domain/2'-5' RNA ligase superfamily n=1 Tax=Leishmania lindenbergi TaxID=651832 RepID=A0AAW3A122_9TRYP